MEIILNAYRINKLETTIFFTFKNIDSKGLKKVNNLVLIQNSNGEYGVIFHLKKDDKNVIKPGNDSFTFRENILTTQDKLRVFYWNDEDVISNNLECFYDFLENNRLDEKVETGNFNCLKSRYNSNLIPKQAGNGGVLGIIDIP